MRALLLPLLSLLSLLSPCESTRALVCRSPPLALEPAAERPLLPFATELHSFFDKCEPAAEQPPLEVAVEPAVEQPPLEVAVQPAVESLSDSFSDNSNDDWELSDAGTEWSEEYVHSPSQLDIDLGDRAIPELDENSRVVAHPDVVFLRCQAEHVSHFRKFWAKHIHAEIVRGINISVYSGQSLEFDFFWRGSLEECKLAMMAVQGGDVMCDTVAEMHHFTGKE